MATQLQNKCLESGKGEEKTVLKVWLLQKALSSMTSLELLEDGELGSGWCTVWIRTGFLKAKLVRGVGTEGRREPNIANPNLAFDSRATPGCPASFK